MAVQNKNAGGARIAQPEEEWPMKDIAFQVTMMIRIERGRTSSRREQFWDYDGSYHSNPEHHPVHGIPTWGLQPTPYRLPWKTCDLVKFKRVKSDAIRYVTRRELGYNHWRLGVSWRGTNKRKHSYNVTFRWQSQRSFEMTSLVFDKLTKNLYMKSEKDTRTCYDDAHIISYPIGWSCRFSTIVCTWTPRWWLMQLQEIRLIIRSWQKSKGWLRWWLATATKEVETIRRRVLEFWTLMKWLR